MLTDSSPPAPGDAFYVGEHEEPLRIAQCDPMPFREGDPPQFVVRSPSGARWVVRARELPNGERRWFGHLLLTDHSK